MTKWPLRREAIDGAAACYREGKKLVALGKGEMA
jgi:hypothetical protein